MKYFKYTIALLIFILPYHKMFLYTRFNSYIFSVIPIGLLLVYLFSGHNLKRLRVRSKPLGFYILIFSMWFIVCIIISYINNIDLINNYKPYVNQLSAISIAFVYYYLTIIYCENSVDIIRMINVLIFSSMGMFLIFLNFYSGIFSPLIGYSMQRFPGFFSSVELTAEYLVINITLCLGMLLFSNTIIRKSKYLIFLIVLLFLGVYTVTRGFIFSVPIVVLSIVILYIKYYRHAISLKALLYVFLLMSTGLIIYNVMPKYIIEYNTERVRSFRMTGEYAFNRKPLFDHSMDVAQDVPLTGYGISAMQEYNSFTTVDYSSPHSLYFYILFITGPIGLVLLIILHIKTILHIIKVRNTYRHNRMNIILVTFFLLWMYWYISQAKIDAIRSYQYYSIIMVYYGITNRVIQLLKNKQVQRVM